MESAGQQRAVTLELIKQTQRWAVKAGDYVAFSELSKLYLTTCAIRDKQTLEYIYFQVQLLSYEIEDSYIEQQRRKDRIVR